MTTSYTLGRAINYSGETGHRRRRPTSSAARGAPTSTARTCSRRASSGTCRSSRRTTTSSHWVLGGWQVSGIFTAYSGNPVNFTASAATLRAPDNTQRPNLNGGDPEVFGDIGPGQLYFDTSVFSAPEQNTWGNMKRFDSIDGPGFWKSTCRS